MRREAAEEAMLCFAENRDLLAWTHRQTHERKAAWLDAAATHVRSIASALEAVGAKADVLTGDEGLLFADVRRRIQGLVAEFERGWWSGLKAEDFVGQLTAELQSLKFKRLQAVRGLRGLHQRLAAGDDQNINYLREQFSVKSVKANNADKTIVVAPKLGTQHRTLSIQIELLEHSLRGASTLLAAHGEPQLLNSLLRLKAVNEFWGFCTRSLFGSNVEAYGLVDAGEGLIAAGGELLHACRKAATALTSLEVQGQLLSAILQLDDDAFALLTASSNVSVVVEAVKGSFDSRSVAAKAREVPARALICLETFALMLRPAFCEPTEEPLRLPSVPLSSIREAKASKTLGCLLLRTQSQSVTLRAREEPAARSLELFAGILAKLPTVAFSPL